MLKKLKENNGGAMLAALILIPVLAAGSLAAYQMANKSATVTMKAAMEEDAIFSSNSVAEILVGEIFNDSTKREQIVQAADGTMLFSTSTTTPGTLTRKDPSPRYDKLVTLYTVKKLPQSAIPQGTEANTIAIEITTRTYNAAAPSWDTVPNIEHVTQQEFNMGLVKVVGCAANYDIFAANDYVQSHMFNFDYFKNVAYYAGNQWSSCGFSAPFSGWSGRSCVDAPDIDHGVKETLSPMCGCGPFNLLCDFCQNSWLSNFISTIKDANCGATAITFENALYGNADVDKNGTVDREQIHKMNINGNDGNPYASAAPYPFNSLEKTVIDHISKNAIASVNHDQAFEAMKADPNVKQIGNWYYRDANNNNVPDADTPYFYHEGKLLEPLPFTLAMFRFRNVYLYVNGDIDKFSMGSSQGINFGQLNLIAKGDVLTIQMMDMKMVSAGLVVMAGGDIRDETMMEMSGISASTMMANNDIHLNKGFKMTLDTRSRMLAGHDIKSFTPMVGSLFTFGTGGKCGCSGGSSETTEMQIGRRYSKS